MSMLDPVPFRVLGDTQRNLFAQRLCAQIERWRHDWVGPQAHPIFVDIPAEGFVGAASAWQGAVGFRRGPAQRPHLMLLIPARCVPGIVGLAEERAELPSWPQKEAVAAKLVEESLSRLASVLIEAAGFGPTVFERATESVTDLLQMAESKRYVAARVALGGAKATFGLLISPTLLDSLVPTRRAASAEPLQRAAAAAGTETLIVEAHLGHSEVTLAELAALAVGDVIVLSEALQSSAILRSQEGAPVARISLGRLEQQRAVRIESFENSKGGQI